MPTSYSLKAVLPPKEDFTEHYRSYYELDTETPLCVAGCDILITQNSMTLYHAMTLMQVYIV